MFGKISLCLAGLCLVSIGVAAEPVAKPEDTKTRLAIQLLEVSRYDRTMQQMVDQMPAMMAKQFESYGECEPASAVISEMSSRISEKVAATLNSEEMKIDVASVYAEVFSEDEMRETIAFYQSPLGMKLLDRMPELMKKAMQISQERMQTIMPDLKQIGEDYGTRIQDAAASCKAPAKQDGATKQKKKK